ncbi:hypothetical protein ALC62_07775 [Cyphomyrmex costatus]|uniref:Uncharacterized protein n=1 Tax=Cyphomyrmex costatus TaxID=456900 RepID=A0A151IHG6_9HYME|nr:hypothetical protein ALC62_07775 [Cyphomyrmex costatus]
MVIKSLMVALRDNNDNNKRRKKERRTRGKTQGKRTNAAFKELEATPLEREEREGGGTEYLLISLQSRLVEMLRSQTHDKGRESKGKFTRCVLEEGPPGGRARVRRPVGPLVLELVAKTVSFYWHAAPRRPSELLSRSLEAGSPKF